MAGRCLICLQLTVKIQGADRRKTQQSYIVPLQRCYIYKIISSTALVAHVCSHTSEECFLIIQRSLQGCVELTPVEIRSASKRSIMQQLYSTWVCCASGCCFQFGEEITTGIFHSEGFWQSHKHAFMEL